MVHELIGKCKGWETMPEKLGKIARSDLHNSQVKPSNRPWKHRIRLKPTWDGSKKLAFDGTHPGGRVLTLVDDKTKLEECIFTVLNADISKKDCDISALYDSFPAVSSPDHQAVWPRVLISQRAVSCMSNFLYS